MTCNGSYLPYPIVTTIPFYAISIFWVDLAQFAIIKKPIQDLYDREWVIHNCLQLYLIRVSRSVVSGGCVSF